MSMISSDPDRTPRNDRRGSASLRGARNSSRRGRRPLEYIDGPPPEMLRELPRNLSLQQSDDRRTKQRLQRLNEAFSKGGFSVNETPSRFGGTIPSPRQSYDVPGRRPAGEGSDRMERERVATLRALLGQMQMPTPPMPTMRDVPDMTPEEIAPYNQPAMDINDVFFGPDRKRFDVVEFLMGLMGRR